MTQLANGRPKIEAKILDFHFFPHSLIHLPITGFTVLTLLPTFSILLTFDLSFHGTYLAKHQLWFFQCSICWVLLEKTTNWENCYQSNFSAPSILLMPVVPQFLQVLTFHSQDSCLAQQYFHIFFTSLKPLICWATLHLTYHGKYKELNFLPSNLQTDSSAIYSFFAFL